MSTKSTPAAHLAVEAVHLREQLVQGLLPFVVGVEAAPDFRQRVQLVYKNDGRL